MANDWAGWRLLNPWFDILDGMACFGPDILMLGTMTELSYLLGVMGMGCLMPLFGRAACAGATRAAVFLFVTFWLYLGLAHAVLEIPWMDRFAFWRSPNPMLPVPGGFGCMGHSHGIYFAMLAVSAAAGWRLVRRVEKHVCRRRVPRAT